MNDKVKEMLNAIGALAESMKFFYDKLTGSGFTEEQAMRFSLCYLNAIARPKPAQDIQE